MVCELCQFEECPAAHLFFGDKITRRQAFSCLAQPDISIVLDKTGQRTFSQKSENLVIKSMPAKRLTPQDVGKLAHWSEQIFGQGIFDAEEAVVCQPRQIFVTKDQKEASTMPDFLIATKRLPPTFVEVTKYEDVKHGKKGVQRHTMELAGLDYRYVQLHRYLLYLIERGIETAENLVFEALVSTKRGRDYCKLKLFPLDKSYRP